MCLEGRVNPKGLHSMIMILYCGLIVDGFHAKVVAEFLHLWLYKPFKGLKQACCFASQRKFE